MCRSLFEECNRAQMIDSVVHMEMKALTSLTPLKIKDIVILPVRTSATPRKWELSGTGAMEYNHGAVVEQAVPVGLG